MAELSPGVAVDFYPAAHADILYFSSFNSPAPLQIFCTDDVNRGSYDATAVGSDCESPNPIYGENEGGGGRPRTASSSPFAAPFRGGSCAPFSPLIITYGVNHMQRSNL